MEVGADLFGADFFGVGDAEGGEDVEGGLPVVAGLVGVAEVEVGVGEAMEGAGFVGGLA